jgi:hypothetical protein
VALAPFPRLCGGCLPVLGDVCAVFPPTVGSSRVHMRLPSSGLLSLHLQACHVLCPMRPTRCRHLPLWGGCPHHSSGVPLPLAGAPRGMPRQPHLHVLVVQGASSSLLNRMCGSAVHRTWWRAVALHASPPHFLRAPSLRVGLRVVPVAGGLCPLAW